MRPSRVFFVIRRPCAVRGFTHFNYSQGMWWEEIKNATHYATQGRALVDVLEWDMSDVEIVCFRETTSLDTQIDDGYDPNHGEDWKK